MKSIFAAYSVKGYDTDTIEITDTIADAVKACDYYLARLDKHDLKHVDSVYIREYIFEDLPSDATVEQVIEYDDNNDENIAYEVSDGCIDYPVGERAFVKPEYAARWGIDPEDISNASQNRLSVDHNDIMRRAAAPDMEHVREALEELTTDTSLLYDLIKAYEEAEA